MRFFSVLLLFTTVLFHSGCRVLAPSVTELLAPDEHGLPMDPFGAAFKDAADGLKNSQLRSSSGHNVGVRADRSHGASRGSHRQKSYTYRRRGYLGDASRNYQRVDPQGYQHGGYEGFPPGSSGYVPSHAGYKANEHGQGVAGSSHYTFPNQVSGSFNDHPSSVGHPVDQYGYQTASGQQLATAGATAFHGRGKQPVEAYQDPAAHGRHPLLLPSPPTMVAPQRSLHLLPGSHLVNPSVGPLNPKQLKAAERWIEHDLIPRDDPNLPFSQPWHSLWRYALPYLSFEPEDAKILTEFLKNPLVQEHLEMWARLYDKLREQGTVPSLSQLYTKFKHPFGLANQVLNASPLYHVYRKAIYHSACTAHATYRLHAIIRGNSVKEGLDASRRDFTQASEQVYSHRHERGASLAVQFIKRLDETEGGYHLLSKAEHEAFDPFFDFRPYNMKVQGST